MANSKKVASVDAAPKDFESLYPQITEWINSEGWIELGRDDHSSSKARVLNEGGMIWEGKTKYKSVDDLFRDVEAGIAHWIEENH